MTQRYRVQQLDRKSRNNPEWAFFTACSMAKPIVIALPAEKAAAPLAAAGIVFS